MGYVARSDVKTGAFDVLTLIVEEYVSSESPQKFCLFHTTEK